MDLQYKYFKIFYVLILTKVGYTIIIVQVGKLNGDVAQLARASGSYPAGRRFKSHRRYQKNTSKN